MLDIIARRTKSVARLRSLWLGVGAWLAVLGSTASASARERSFSLAWSAPAECPDAADVEAYVEADLGASAYGPSAVHARGSVSAVAEGRYSVELELALDAAGAQSSRRTLVGSSCEAVSQAAALLVTLAIRAQVTPAAAPRAPAPVPVKATSWHERPFVGVGVLTDWGSLPRPTVGLGVAGGASWVGLRLEPGIAYYAPQSGNVAGRSELGARFALATAGARVCTPFPASRWWVAPCLGGGVDWIRATGFGARTTRNASTWQAVTTAAVLGGWDISPIISLRLEVSAALPLARPEFMVDGVGNVYRRAPLALRSAFGLELHF